MSWGQMYGSHCQPEKELTSKLGYIYTVEFPTRKNNKKLSLKMPESICSNRNLFLTAGANVNSAATVEDSLMNCSKAKHRLSVKPSTSIPQHLSR